MMKNIHIRIKSKRKELGYSQTLLAEMLGVKPQSISAWERGIAKPLGAKLQKLSKVFNVSPQWLLDGIETIPIFTDVKVSAGVGVENNEPHCCNDLFQIPIDILQNQNNNNKSDIFCVIAKGDSMSPIIKDGAVLAVNPTKKEIVDGRIYVINYRGTLRVKILKQEIKGLTIESYNPEYNKEFVEWNHLSGFEIVGEVFWYSSYLYKND